MRAPDVVELCSYASQTSSIESLQHVRFSGGRAWASDGSLVVSVGFELAFVGLLPAKPLQKWLKAQKLADVRAEVVRGSSRITLRCGSSRIVLNALPLRQSFAVPKPEPGEECSGVNLSSKQVQTLLRFADTSDTGDASHWTYGLSVVEVMDSWWACATDGLGIVAFKLLDPDYAAREGIELIPPSRPFRLPLNALKLLDRFESFSLNEHSLNAENDVWRLQSVTLDVETADIQMLAEGFSDSEFFELPEDFTARLAAVHNVGGKSVANETRLQSSDGVLEIRSDAGVSGQVVETVEIPGLPDFSARVPSRGLSDIAKHATRIAPANGGMLLRFEGPSFWGALAGRST